MFDVLLFNLRAQGLKVGLSEWLLFLRALKEGLASDLGSLYFLARALLVHSEAHFDLFDVAFSATFSGIQMDPKLEKAFERWIEQQRWLDENRPPGEHHFKDFEALMEAFRRTLEQQTERHDGGDRWVGTGGTSPWGAGGRANQGLQLGQNGGGRSGVRLADERRWINYRTDVTLEVRDFKVALRALRKLAREGEEVLDLDQTIDTTARNAGEIELVYSKERRNRVHLVLFMDAGGSMTPHTELVERLFTATRETKTFKTFSHYYFHNAIYEWLYEDYENYQRTRTSEVLADLTPAHRLIFVGDASMGPWELFTSATGLGTPVLSGLNRFKMFAWKCPASVWLNPDPRRFWNHPTVSAIGAVLRMYPLTLDGLRESVQFLRAPV